MKKIFLIAFSLFYLCHLSNAQVTLNPYFWDQELSYNPAGVGALVDESVQMSLTTKSGPYYFDLFAPQITSIANTSIGEPRIQDIKNIFYLSYQKTHTFANKKRLSAGVQFQKAENARLLLHDPSTFSFTANFHLPRFKTNIKVEYLSLGLQMNLLFRKPNDTALDFLFIELSNSIDDIDPIKFRDQFKDTGTQNTLGINYTEHRFDKSIFNFGFNFINLQYKTSRRLSTSLASYSFFNETSNSFRALLGYQFIVNKKLQLEFKAKTQAKFVRPTSVSSNPISLLEASLGVSAGFKLGYENILRLTCIFGAYSDSGILPAVGISLDQNKYSFNLSLSRNFTVLTGDGYLSNDLLQLGVNYKLNMKGLPTLLRMNN